MPAMWASFSWAGKIGSRRPSAVRPCEDVCEGGEEGREIRGQKKAFAPSLAEYGCGNGGRAGRSGGWLPKAKEDSEGQPEINSNGVR